jgi:hypothetical protein
MLTHGIRNTDEPLDPAGKGAMRRRESKAVSLMAYRRNVCLRRRIDGAEIRGCRIVRVQQ